jgi:fatty acid desaturase
VSTTAFTSDEQEAIEEKGFMLRMACLPASVIGLYFLARPWPADTWAVYVLWTCFTAYSMFCWTNCFHETGHQTLTKWRWLDITIGRLLGTLMCLPYTVYRESHVRHHAYVNRPNDWELWPYVNPTCSLAFRRVFVFLDICFGFIVAPFVLSRIFFHVESPLTKPTLRRAIWFEYLGIIVFWGLVLSRLAYTGAWLAFAKVWLVPHIIAGIMQTVRRLTEHLGMASFDPMLGTRTVIGKSWITRLSSYVNFDIFVHGPHHRHPRLAHNQLADKMDEYLLNHPETTYPVYSSYLEATRAMLPCLFKNPGIGVNAGAPPPGPPLFAAVPTRVADVTDFPADMICEAR